MIKILQVRNIDSFVESRRQKTSEKDRKIVQSILNDIRKNGDSAVKKYERKFNGRKTSQMRVSAKEIKEARSKISSEELKALKRIQFWLTEDQKVLKSHLQNYERYSVEQFAPGDYEVGSTFIPISSVGCYVPGGQARYPSSVVMSVVPAKVAGVKKIVVVSPPRRDGKIDPLTKAQISVK